MNKKLHVAYLFTTFPVKSETFLQREIECVRKEAIDLTLFSLWGGKSRYKGIAIKRFNRVFVLLLPLMILATALRRPLLFCKAVKSIFSTKPKSFLNIGENIVGLAFALSHVHYFRRESYDLIHATWATMPAAGALVLSKLTGIPFSMGAHAYDIFKDEGDSFLKNKLKNSRFVHTSSDNAARRLNEFEESGEKIQVIRRGLPEIPDFEERNTNTDIFKIISIGRFVEKKGFLRQIEIYKRLKDRGIQFKANIIGEGALRRSMEEKIKDLSLEDKLELLPWMPYSELEKVHNEADLLLFTGIVAKDGDRDGLPNVIPEVMAKRIPVISSCVSAIPEIIVSNVNGILIEDYDNTDAWCDAIDKTINDAAFYNKLARNARNWVEDNYDGRKNAKTLVSLFRKAAT